MAEKLTKAERKFYKAEGDILDRVYREKMNEWQKLTDMYNLRFRDQIRDIDRDNYVKISRFYPLVRQIIASIAFNYPTMLFTVDEEEGAENDIPDVLERASAVAFNLMDVKRHVHQAIFDALFCGVGWIRIDYNPPGDDMIPPYVTNDAMHEDFTAVNRVAPGFVHLDPLCPPHDMGQARYIREKMWVPLKQLKADPDVKMKDKIAATTVEKRQDMGFGEPHEDQSDQQEDFSEKARKDSIENGDFVLVERWHDRINKRMVMFADGVEEEIMIKRHPFAKMTFPQAIDALGTPIFEEDDATPVLDIENGSEAPGWLVENGFAFVPVKFDLHNDSFVPLGHLKYVEDIQEGIVESFTRQSDLLKRTARQGVVNEEEVEANTNILENLRRGTDGEWHKVKDVNNFKELVYGSVPPDQVRYQHELQRQEEEITRVTDISESGATPRTATEAALIGAAVSVNREWMESAVANVYQDITQNCFRVMGDPRYTPENFLVNMAPEGKGVLRRAMTSMDFMWNYQIEVAAGSTQPLFEQIQGEKFNNFYDRASQRPTFNQMELDKALTIAAGANPAKMMNTTDDPEAIRAAQLENIHIATKGEDPGVLPEQDHKSHMEVHAQYQSFPTYQQMVQAAQEVNENQIPTNPRAAEMIQQIDALMQAHNQAHEQAQAQQIGAPAPAAASGGGGGDSLQSTVRGNAQNVANTVNDDVQQRSDGA